MSYYVHHIPGRLRIKIPTLKGNPLKASEVESVAYSIIGVKTVTPNPTTGSILINYDPSVVDSQRILDILRREGYIHPCAVIEQDRTFEQTVSKTGKFIGKALLGFAVEKAFEGTPLALLTVLL